MKPRHRPPPQWHRNESRRQRPAVGVMFPSSAQAGPRPASCFRRPPKLVGQLLPVDPRPRSGNGVRLDDDGWNAHRTFLAPSGCCSQGRGIIPRIHGAGKPPARFVRQPGGQGTSGRQRLRTVPDAEGTPAPARRQSVRRAAAATRDRPGAADGAEAHLIRRADGGYPAEHRRADRGHHHSPEPRARFGDRACGAEHRRSPAAPPNASSSWRRVPSPRPVG